MFLVLLLLTHFSRAENKETIQEMLSEDAKQRRRRTNAVNIQMTIFAWSLEFVTGLVNLAIGIKIHHPESNIDFITCMVLFDGFLNFIIIPSSYIMNNEVLKTAIMAEGWYQIIRRRILSDQAIPAANAAENQEGGPANQVPAVPQPRRRNQSNQGSPAVNDAENKEGGPANQVPSVPQPKHRIQSNTSQPSFK